MNHFNSVTQQILKVVGSPFADLNSESNIDISGLYQYAAKNRMPLLYLEALKRLGRLSSLEEEHNKLIGRHARTVEAISRVSKVLDRAGIDYTLFKSIRPYNEVTVDIDILIFGDEYNKTIKIMRRAGYVFLSGWVPGPLSITFRDVKSRINLDIYNEIGVSHVIYLDKDILRRFVTRRKLSSGEAVLSLSPHADLLAIIAHSVLKEHMYVLSEYYTTLYYMADMKSDILSSFLSLIDKCNMRSAVRTHLGTTALLHYWAHRFIPACLMMLLDELGLNHLELSRVKKMSFRMPYKYHPFTVINALTEKLADGKTRKSLALQTWSMLNPKFTSSMVNELRHHITRETY